MPAALVAATLEVVPLALVGKKGDSGVFGKGSHLTYEINPTRGAIANYVSGNNENVLGIGFESWGKLLALDSSAGIISSSGGATSLKSNIRFIVGFDPFAVNLMAERSCATLG